MSFKFVELFGLIRDVANNNRTNEFQCSFFLVYFKDKKELSSECQSKTCFFVYNSFFFLNLVKVIGFRAFFFFVRGEGGPTTS